MMKWLRNNPKAKALEAIKTLGLEDNIDARIVFNINGANPESSVIPDQSFINAAALKEEIGKLQAGGTLTEAQAEAAATVMQYLERNHGIAAAVRVLAENGDGAGIVLASRGQNTGR